MMKMKAQLMVNTLKYVIGKSSHSIATLVIMFVALLLNVELIVGMLLIGFFFGREHAQAEQRGISKFYDNKRSNAPWYVGFELRSWNSDSYFNDFLVPSAICILFNLV